MPQTTNTPRTLAFATAEGIDTVLVTYDRMRWYRSTSEHGLYEAVSAPAATAAVLTAPRTSPHDLEGLTLRLQADGLHEDSILFVDVNPVTSVDAAARIDGSSIYWTSTADAENLVTVTSVLTGTGAAIEVLESEGALPLGLNTGDTAFGMGVDSTLVPGTSEYFFIDNHSADTYFYRTQYINSLTGAESDLSQPFSALPDNTVPLDQTTVVYLRLTDLSGSPLPNRKVTIANTFAKNRVALTNGQYAGVFRGHLEKTTDKTGYVEFRILRGIEIDFAIEGTNFVRRLTIPETGDTVDLLDPTLETADEFGIHDQGIDFAIRLSD